MDSLVPVVQHCNVEEREILILHSLVPRLSLLVAYIVLIIKLARAKRTAHASLKRSILQCIYTTRGESGNEASFLTLSNFGLAHLVPDTLVHTTLYTHLYINGIGVMLYHTIRWYL